MQIHGHKKVFFLNAVRMVLLLFVLDFAVAAGMKSLYLKQRTGRHHRITYSIAETRADVLIFGSSRANRHFIPARISETLRLSCYNSGVQGKGILFTHALQSLVLDRHVPRLIVLNIDPDMLYERPDQYAGLGDLLPYYDTHRELLEPFVELKSRFEKVKLLSRVYPYNSTIAHIVRYRIKPQVDYDGYRPLHGRLPETYLERYHRNTPADTRPVERPRIDENFENALTGFIANAAESGATLFFVASPTCFSFDYSNNASFTRIKQIADSNGVPIIDFTDHEQFLGKYTLFQDSHHLNNDGAQLLSTLLAEEIKRSLDRKSK